MVGVTLHRPGARRNDPQRSHDVPVSPTPLPTPSVREALDHAAATAPTTPGCSSGLTSPPWDEDAFVPGSSLGYGPGASMDDVAPVGMPRQQTLPEDLRDADEDELQDRIVAARRALGDRVVLLGHFYQRDEVVRHADYVGDSFQLARAATAHPDAEAMVFCGVHFMAETADLLSGSEQAVVLPHLGAGCSMADMADVDSVADCWEQLEALYGTEADDQGRQPVVPVTYMNSSAALKAFVGERGGIVCTSSNASAVLEWAFERGRRVLFFPDQHLGRNTAKAMGVPLERMPTWAPGRPLGGNTAEQLEQARVILWHGFCSVHRRFTVDQIERARAEHPGVHVMVHPECPMPVVDAADSSGSTDAIVKTVQAAPAGSTFAIGTEINLVQRLAAQHPEHTIFCLDPVICPCSTMYRVHPAYLAWVLEELVAGRVANRITVPGEQAEHARTALRRMLAVAPSPARGTATGQADR